VTEGIRAQKYNECEAQQTQVRLASDVALDDGSERDNMVSGRTGVCESRIQHKPKGLCKVTRAHDQKTYEDTRYK